MPEQQPLLNDRPPDLHQIIDELGRELNMRKAVYPSWVAKGKLTRATADYRIQCIEKAIEELRARASMLSFGVDG